MCFYGLVSLKTLGLLISIFKICLQNNISIQQYGCQTGQLKQDSVNDICNGISKFAFEENVCVDIVGYSSLNSTDDKIAKDTVATFLRSLLSSQLSKDDFYFVSGKQKHVLNANVNNGDISYTTESLDLDLTSNTNNSNGIVSDDHSIFGSPLKLQTIANLSAKASYAALPVVSEFKRTAAPIPLCDARKLLAKFGHTDVHRSSVNMIVIFCDGSDYNKTIFLGKQIRKDSDKEGTVITTFRITADTAKLSDVDQSLEVREQGYKLTAQYKVMDVIDGLGSILLEAKWSDRCGRMKLTKLQSAEFSLHVSILADLIGETFWGSKKAAEPLVKQHVNIKDTRDGSDQSPVFNYYCQLQKVKLFLEGLKTGELPEVLSQKTQKAVTQLQEFLTKIKDGETAVGGILPSEDNRSAASIAGMLCGTGRQLNLEPSVEADFTDMIWHFVRNCTDLHDLIQCFNVTFCHLKRGDLKVFVHKTNETTIAKLVRQSYYGMASFPTITGHLSLCMAVEIGLEKIRKDYNAIFINNDLCTSWQWDAFIQTLTSSQEESMNMEENSLRSLESQFNILNDLHHCLDIVSVVDSFTSNQDLRSITKHAVNYCKTGNVAKFHSFSVPITALQVIPEIKKHSLSSVKRESVDATTGNCSVISLMTELPDELTLPNVVSLIENGNISCHEDSREFYLFKYQEHTIHIDAKNHVG